VARPPQPGDLIADRYELEELVGTGGMSSVFRARDRQLERRIAIKILYEHYADDPEYLERFRREARAVAKLSHPNIVTVIDRGDDDGRQYIVFEHVDGENLKDTDPRAKSYQEYRDYAGVDEGMSGVSTRFAFKILSKVFNFDPAEIAANPVHLMYVLEQQIEREQFPAETEQKYLGFIKEHLSARYAEFIGKEIQTAYLESYSEYGQNIFDRYVTYADYWIQDHEYRDTDTGEVFDRASLNAELEKIEKPAGIANPKDFRNEIVKFSLRSRAHNGGKNPTWTSYEKIREVIEKRIFSQVEDLLPVISFGSKKDGETEKKHGEFVERMVERGYTERQVRRLVEWYMRVKQAG